MLRKRLLILKHLLLALLSLAGGIGLLELSLLFFQARWPAGGDSAVARRELVTPCWRMHHVLKPLQSIRTVHPDSGQEVLFRTNSLGLRGPEFSSAREADSLRVLLLGDETVLGAEVDEQQTVSAQLEQLLARQTGLRVEVLNAGVPGYCPLLSQLQYRHLLAGLRADLVILHVDMTDIADDYRCRRHTRQGDDGPLACAHPVLASGDRKTGMQALMEDCRIVCWARKRLGGIPLEAGLEDDFDTIESPQGRFAWLRDSPPDWSIHIRQALQPVQWLARQVSLEGGRLILSTSPAPWQVSPVASSGARARAGIPADAVYSSRRPFEWLEETARNADIPLCDSSTAFSAAEQPETLFLQASRQLSAEGHALYARALAECLWERFPALRSRGNSPGTPGPATPREPLARRPQPQPSEVPRNPRFATRPDPATGLYPEGATSPLPARAGEQPRRLIERRVRTAGGDPLRR